MSFKFNSKSKVSKNCNAQSMLIQKSNKNQKLSQTINELPEDITSDKYSSQINEIYQNLVENQKSLVSTELS